MSELTEAREEPCEETTLVSLTYRLPGPSSELRRTANR